MTRVRLGFVPLADCAPLVVAQEKGFFAREGLEVELRKIQAWPLLLQKLQEGAVDGAHMLSTLPVLAAAGAPGIEAPLCTAWTMSTCGNAITLSNALFRAEATTPEALSAWLDRDPSRILRIGIVLPRSTQELTIREWLARSGLEIGRRVELIVCPPPEMVRRLREGLIDGFCSGEPWNQRATGSKLGGIAVLGDSVLPDLPEKVLAVRQAWHKRDPDAHMAVLRALEGASAWVSREENHEEASRILAGKFFVNTQQGLLRSALSRRLDAGWRREIESEGFLRFTGMNKPRREGFLGILERLVWWGHLPPSALESDLGEVCLESFHDRAFACEAAAA
ncbi:MAG: ABC transporter substrate-binding protein [Fibrobacteria bacterium]|nr:ABC transporter substrate-binding protein [Fibrobacteria bacterium]